MNLFILTKKKKKKLNVIIMRFQCLDYRIIEYRYLANYIKYSERKFL